jgi:hypothetical protein
MGHKYATPILEKDFQQQVVDICELYDLAFYHTHDSRRSVAGFPDLVVVGGSVLYAELKTETGRVSKAQQWWIDRLEAAGEEVHVWRPSDLGDIAERLRRLRGAAASEVTTREAAVLLDIPETVIAQWKHRGRVTPAGLLRGQGRGGLAPLYRLDELRPLAAQYHATRPHEDT